MSQHDWRLLVMFGIMLVGVVAVWPLLPPRSDRVRRLLGELPPGLPRDLSEESRCYAELKRGVCPTCRADNVTWFDLDTHLMNCDGCGAMYRIDAETMTAQPVSSLVAMIDARRLV